MSPQQHRRELCLSKNPLTRPLPLEPGVHGSITKNNVTLEAEKERSPIPDEGTRLLGYQWAWFTGALRE